MKSRRAPALIALAVVLLASCGLRVEPPPLPVVVFPFAVTSPFVP